MYNKYARNRFIALFLSVCMVFVAHTYVFSADALNLEIENSQIITNDTLIQLDETDVPETIVFSEAVEKGHIVRKRELETDMSTVAFGNEDGTETLYMFSEPVKYRSEDGSIKDKSTNLTVSGTDLVMEDNDINVSFPQSISQGISVSKADMKITMVPNFASISMRTLLQDSKIGKNNKVVYANAFGTGIDLKYTAILSGVKEDIILNSYTEKNEFSFIVNTNGLYPVRNENGSCSFYDPNTDVVEAEMMQVFCFDSVGNYAGGDITVTEMIQYQKYIITVIPDIDFLTSETTVYPVTVDPTITFNLDYSVKDTVIYSGKPDHNYGSHTYSTIGYLDSTYKIGEMLIKFPVFNSALNNLPAENINSAAFTMYTASESSLNTTLKAYAIPSTWDTWDEDVVTWNDIYPVMLAPTRVATTNVPLDDMTATVFDLLNVARGWLNGTYSATQGLLICNSSESNASYARDFLTKEYALAYNSAYMPRLVVEYTPYHIMSIDCDSTAYTMHNHAASVSTLDLNATLIVNTIRQETDNYLVYTMDNAGLNASINSDTGVITLRVPDYNGVFDHDTGTMTVTVAYENDSSVSETITVNVVCDAFPLPMDNSTTGINKVGARYISIGYDEIRIDDDGSGIDQLREMATQHNLGNVVTHLNVDFEEDKSEMHEGEYFWLKYTNRDTYGVAYSQRLLELIRTSKVVSIVTHGSPEGLSMSSTNSNLLLTTEDILELHDGYFSYCELVLYLSCSSGSSSANDINDHSLVSATVEKGAGAAIGFKMKIEVEDAQAFEYTFYSFMRKDQAYKWDPPLHEAADEGDCNYTIIEAGREAAIIAGIDLQYVVFEGNCNRRLSS